MARIIGKLLSDTTGGMMLRVVVILSILLLSPMAVAADRVISLGGTVTEIIFALEQEDRLVANDASSIYPEEAKELPRVGYYRDLSLEGILALQPDLIIASENAGPPEVLERIRSMGVETVTVSDEPGVDSLYKRLEQVAAALNVEHAGAKLGEQIRASLDALSTGAPSTRSALVILHRGGPLLAAGSGTSADALLKLSGLDNVTDDTMQGYKPMSSEALAALAPEIIFTSTASAEAAGGLAAFAAHPGIATTPAAQSNRVFAIDDLLLLGMGPRVAEAVALLRKAAN